MKKGIILLVLFVTVKMVSAQMPADSLVLTNDGFAIAKIKTSAVCDMCKETLEKAMAYEKGVKESSLDVDSKILTVTFNPKKTTLEKIRLAIVKTGYDADGQLADERAYNNLNACCKKDAHH
jgi:periplasmic mercuric ion binding protein